MPKLAAAIVAAFAVILAMLIWGTGNANAANVSPTRHACIAFQQWNHHKTSHSARVMLAASKHANATIKTDLVVLYTEYMQHDTFDLPADTRLTAIDCKPAR